MAKPSDEYETPPELFHLLNDEFAFNADACASHENAKVPFYWTEQQDGLAQEWSELTVWVNPPYSDPGPWIDKAIQTPDAEIVLLLPADTSTQWFRRVFAYADEIRLMVGRVKFVGAPQVAKFGSFVAVFRRAARGWRHPGHPRVCLWAWRFEAYPNETVASRAPARAPIAGRTSATSPPPAPAC